MPLHMRGMWYCARHCTCRQEANWPDKVTSTSEAEYHPRCAARRAATSSHRASAAGREDTPALTSLAIRRRTRRRGCPAPDPLWCRRAGACAMAPHDEQHVAWPGAASSPRGSAVALSTPPRHDEKTRRPQMLPSRS